MSNFYDAPPQSIQYPEPEPDDLAPIEIDMGDDDLPYRDGVEQPDGSMDFTFGEPERETKEPESFDDNLAEYMDESELNKIAADLLRGIEDDIQSSAQWRDNLALGIKLLGTIIEPSSTDAGTTSTVFEGQHKTTHPLLLEACLTFQANARASLLPASGPVKIRDDQPNEPPQQPMPPMMGHNGGPPMDEAMAGSPFGQPPPMQGGDGAEEIPGGMNGGAYAHGGGVDYTRNRLITPEPHDSWVEWAHANDRYADGGYVNGYADGGQPQPAQAAPSLNINVTGDQSQAKENQGQNQAGVANTGMPQTPAVPVGQRDALADALEKDFNHYLTSTDKGYYPDTDRMLFMCGLAGTAIKKVYGCPLRRRPVSESVPIEDFIVSNAFADLCNMPRITQRVMMRPSVLRRMQLVGAYREIELADPQENDQQNEVKQMKADTVGFDIHVNDDEDMDYEIYETYCELELDQFAPEWFKGKGLPLPYKVVIDKNSEKVLEIRRNWKEDDRECTAKEYFVDFSYVKAFGFYGLGLMHILGNTTRTLTAAWREFIDSGMFANFPGFVFSKGAGRQLTNNFRVPPGGGVGLDTGLADIRNAVMPLPYKDLTAAFVAFIQHVEEYGKALGGTANINVGEGKQDAPVGTTLALIEQATKPLGAVLKRLHTAQGREFELLKERFKEDPGAFTRFNKKPAMQWQEAQFIQALDDFDLVPVSDPNNPTNLHRIAKGQMLYQMAQADPGSFKRMEGYKYIFALADMGDADNLLAGDQQPQPDPKVMDSQLKAQMTQLKSQNDLMIERMRLMDRQADRTSKERIAQIDREMEKMKLASTLAIHHSTQEMQSADRALELKQTSEANGQGAEMDQGQAAMQQAAQIHDAQSQREHDAAQAEAQRVHDAQQAQYDRMHQAGLHAHKVNTDAAIRRHKTVTDAEARKEAARIAAAARAKSQRTAQ